MKRVEKKINKSTELCDNLFEITGDKMKRIAYLILAHNDPIHFNKLIESLGRNCDIYVHIDKKSDISVFKEARKMGNVSFLEKRFSVSWAGISMIDAQMELIKIALQNSREYTHLVFLSGSCYPIKSVDYISEMFMRHPKREFIKFLDMRESPEIYLTYVTKKWFIEPLFFKSTSRVMQKADRALRKLLSLIWIPNNWPPNIIPYFGSQWCALTSDCCKYILDYQAANPWYRDINKYSFAPDEHYIHTLVGNSPFLANSDGIQPFKGKGTWRMANLHIIDISLSRWFTINDWEEIRASDKMFVRKVRTLDGVELVEKINRCLLSQQSGELDSSGDI